ncbi:MAG: YjjG family noncanonical pyrimidine nucleotidase [Clostridia bacterium]|nr:YjjG family noncanonical pyrimidine nucleotidase [Clostridia bacterium]
MIKDILFDLDDTIFDFGKAEENALKKTLLSIGVEPTEEAVKRYSEINLSQWKLLELGKLTRKELTVRRFKIFFDELGIEADTEKVNETYKKFLSQGHFFIDGAEKLLDELYGKYRLYLASNGTACVQSGRIASSGISKYFEHIFISEEIGFNKPSREFFDACFAKIQNFNADSTVIVGDSLTSDILGGINAGIHTVWFNARNQAGREDIKPEYEIKNLRELAGLLREYNVTEF